MKPPFPRKPARGVRREPGVMNRLEADYAMHLELRKRAGEIEWFAFDAVKLRLAKATFYEFDFFVMLSNGELEAHEVKGHWEDDARVKIKVAASMYPLRFLAITRPSKEKGWQIERFTTDATKPAPIGAEGEREWVGSKIARSAATRLRHSARKNDSA